MQTRSSPPTFAQRPLSEIDHRLYSGHAHKVGVAQPIHVPSNIALYIVQLLGMHTQQILFPIYSPDIDKAIWDLHNAQTFLNHIYS
jgi:hypothetical protein